MQPFQKISKTSPSLLSWIYWSRMYISSFTNVIILLKKHTCKTHSTWTCCFLIITRHLLPLLAKQIYQKYQSKIVEVAMRRRSLWLECSLHEKTNLHAIILRWHTFMQRKSSKVIQSLSQIFTNQLVAQTQGRVSRRIICELFHLHDCVSSVERFLLLDLDRGGDPAICA